MPDHDPPFENVGGRVRLLRLLGEELSAITLVRDYVQFDFGGPTFNFYVWPELTVDGQKYVHGAEGYLDAAASFINHQVTTADVIEGKSLEITFDDGRALFVGLDDNARMTEESVNYFDMIRKVWAA